MDRKLSVVANVRYQTPRGNGATKLKGLMRYLQYRNDRDGHIPQKHGQERWIDHGLGNNFQTIASNCESLKSEHVQAFTFVINPAPDLVAMIPERRHGAFVRALTEVTIERFFEERGIDDVPYSYVVHHRETTDEKQPGRANPHAHIILPGTYYNWADGAYVPLYMNRGKNENHIALLHEIAQQEIDRTLQRYIGLDWELRYDRLIAERERLAQIPEPSPEPTLPESTLDQEPDDLELPWSGPSLDL